jgi:hypothetical protein
MLPGVETTKGCRVLLKATEEGGISLDGRNLAAA